MMLGKTGFPWYNNSPGCGMIEQCVVKEHRDCSRLQNRIKGNKPKVRIKQGKDIHHEYIIVALTKKTVFAVQYSAG